MDLAQAGRGGVADVLPFYTERAANEGFLRRALILGNGPLAKELAQMRPGDVVTHCFHGNEGGLLDAEGRRLVPGFNGSSRRKSKDGIVKKEKLTADAKAQKPALALRPDGPDPELGNDKLRDLFLAQRNEATNDIPSRVLDAVIAFAEPIVVQSFDRDRPLWEITFIEKLKGHQTAVVLKVHHSLTDGVGGMDIARLLFDAEADPGEQPVDDQRAQHARRHHLLHEILERLHH